MLSVSQALKDKVTTLDFKKEAPITQTADGIRQEVSKIKVGGRNLLLKSNETITLQGVRWTDLQGKKWSEI